MFVAACGFDQVTDGGEREVIAGDQHAVGGGAIEQLLARADRFRTVDVERGLPVRMACEDRRMLRGIASTSND